MERGGEGASTSSAPGGAPLGERRWALERLRATNPVFKELVAGGTAGAVAKTAVAPLERVKILFQTGGMRQASVAGTVRHIVRAEGGLGLWRGNSASVLRVVPYAALHFSFYERFRVAFSSIGEARGAAWLASSPLVDLLAGSAAGGAAVAVTYPLDLLRTRLAWRTSDVRPPGSGQATLRATLAAIWRQDGMRGMYRGCGPTLLGVLPYAGLKFYVYQLLKRQYCMPAGSAPDAPLSSAQAPATWKLAFGALAGLAAQTATYPIDVVRRRMQVQDMMAGGAHMSSTWQGLRLIVREQGLKGLTAGLSINYLKVVPSTAIGFAVYDSAKDLLQHKTSI